MVVVSGTPLGLAPKALVRRLRRAGVRDYQLLGDRPGDVSVGVFDQAGNAEVRLEEMQNKGFPAEIISLTRGEPKQFLAIELPADSMPRTFLEPVLAVEGLLPVRLAQCSNLVAAHH